MSSSTFQPAYQPQKTLERILKSDIEFDVTTVNKAPQKRTMAKLIEEAKAANQDIILTFTPGPFVDLNGELPGTSWMSVSAAKGCTAQLNSFDTAMLDLNARVYAVNNKPSEYQCGIIFDGEQYVKNDKNLLATKNWQHLQMISDSEGKLQKEWELDTITVDDKKYLSRFTVVIPSSDPNKAQYFPLASPIDADIAKQHIAAIQTFLVSVKENKKLDAERVLAFQAAR